jgi:hypothetical protein
MQGLTYQDFRKNHPSKEIQARHREEISKAAREKSHREMERAKIVRQQYEPYRKAMVEFYKSHGVAEPPSLTAQQAKKLREVVPLEAPKALRLGRRIFRTGSATIIDVPSASDPFAAWVDTENASPGNNASSWGGADGATGIVWLSAVAGLDGPGGTTNGWGYVGQYFNFPQVGFLIIGAAPTIRYSQTWGVNGFNYANQTLYVNIRVLVWDNATGLQTDVIDFPGDNINPISQNAPWNQGPTYPEGYTTVPQLSGVIGVDTLHTYGIFVQIQTWSEGSGGSWAWGTINCVLPELGLFENTPD